MSEPVAEMLERWELELKLSTDGDTIWYGHALPFLTDTAPRLLALVRAGEALAEVARRYDEARQCGEDLSNALAAWDEVATEGTK